MNLFTLRYQDVNTETEVHVFETNIAPLQYYYNEESTQEELNTIQPILDKLGINFNKDEEIMELTRVDREKIPVITRNQK